jgi:hypothetical protein
LRQENIDARDRPLVLSAGPVLWVALPLLAIAVVVVAGVRSLLLRGSLHRRRGCAVAANWAGASA